MKKKKHKRDAMVDEPCDVSGQQCLVKVTLLLLQVVGTPFRCYSRD